MLIVRIRLFFAARSGSLSGHSAIDKVVKLINVSLGEADSGGCHYRASYVLYICFLAKVLLAVSQPVVDVGVRAGVLWFFLGPCYTGFRVILHLCDNFLEWERTETFNSDDGNIIFALLCSGFLNVEVNLT